jgi:hypothetical protein
LRGKSPMPLKTKQELLEEEGIVEETYVRPFSAWAGPDI